MKIVMDDHQLLDEFVKARSQRAFGELVERHLPVVYSVARRLVGDAQLAEEVAQNVLSTPYGGPAALMASNSSQRA